MRLPVVVLVLVAALVVGLSSQAPAKSGQMTVRVVSNDGHETPIVGALVQTFIGWDVENQDTTDHRGRARMSPLQPLTRYSVEVTYKGVVYWVIVYTDKNASHAQVTFRVAP